MIKVFLLSFIVLAFLDLAVGAKQLQEDSKSFKGTTVHVIFSNHVDLGFSLPNWEIAYDVNVYNKYFHEYFPRAIENVKQLQANNRSETFIYTTQAYLISLFFQCPNLPGLRCPSQQQKEDMTQAIAKNYITWHALPHNGQVELYSKDLLDYSIAMVHQLDERFNQTKKTVASLRDVPGITKGAINIFRKRNVKGLSMGVNIASAPPGVLMKYPFRWLDDAKHVDLLTIYNPGGYGGVLPVGEGKPDIGVCSQANGSVIVGGLQHILCLSYRTDNEGPAPYEEIIFDYEHLKREFPNATIKASTYENYFHELNAVRDEIFIPAIVDEIGDTWIHGVSSDPKKLQQYRSLARIRSAMVKSGTQTADPNFAEFSRMLLKIPEHTWGVDVKTNFKDYYNWRNAEFHQVL